MNVAIKLFHGRKTVDQDMQDRWGDPGPVFIVPFAHVTYTTDIKLGDGELMYVDDLVYYDGVYYGDWSVFPVALLDEDPELKGRVQTFDQRKADLRPEDVTRETSERRAIKALMSLSPAFAEGVRTGLLKPEWVDAALHVITGYLCDDGGV